MTRINSIRIVLAIAVRSFELHQMDVKTTFLNGDLDEEIYMEQPKGVFSSRTRKENLSIGEIVVWAKTSTKTMT